jgi:hypothetical protein
MKTKTTKIKKFPDIGLPKTPDREPTDAELKALAAEEIDETEAPEAQAAAPQLASSTVDLARLGLNEVAYVRRAVVDEVPIWSIHSASGHPLGAAPTLEQAWGAIIQNELQPVHVH